MAGKCGRLVLTLLFCAGAVNGALANGPTFVTSDQCIACHSNITNGEGETLSIGHDWRASMMSLSAKDPYWQAAVRRELTDHPEHRAEIEDLCSVCHMPMFRTKAVANGGSGEIVRYLDGGFDEAELELATDGVSCSVCHQISPENLGEHASFDGGYIIDSGSDAAVYGPYEVDEGRTHLMRSASGLAPAQSPHMQSSELCATCHTLSTPTRDAAGSIVGHFAEQAPYLEWQESDYARSHSCQDCHMPELTAETPITSVLGEARSNVSRHTFRGGNAFMLGLLDRYRDELDVATPSSELQSAIAATVDHLQKDTADLTIQHLDADANQLEIDVRVTARTGHKLPTAYPSRRVWLRMAVTADGSSIFDSGRLDGNGGIVGNDNDEAPDAFEPHYQTITTDDEVQIYETIILDRIGQITTSLVAADHYAKDNRLLPNGFDKATVDADVRVHGQASDDQNFTAGSDTVRYVVQLPGEARHITVRAELWYQPIAYRWAHNLAEYEAYEAQRFVRYYRENAKRSATLLAEAEQQLQLD